MLLQRAVIITLSTLFLTVGCASAPNPEQTANIINLENMLTDIKQNLFTLDQENIDFKVEVKQNKLALAQANIDLVQTKFDLEQTTFNLEQTKKEAASLKKTLRKKIKKNKKNNYLDKTVLGETEWIYLVKAKENFKARIDTGATTSSINALDIQPFERDGKKWVRFNIAHSEATQKKVVEARVIRTAKIIQSNQLGKRTQRLVVKLHVHIGGIEHQSEFTLTDRSHMDYPVLIGRSFIQDIALVDVSESYIHPKYQAQVKR